MATQVRSPFVHEKQFDRSTRLRTRLWLQRKLQHRRASENCATWTCTRIGEDRRTANAFARHARVRELPRTRIQRTRYPSSARVATALLSRTSTRCQHAPVASNARDTAPHSCCVARLRCTHVALALRLEMQRSGHPVAHAVAHKQRVAKRKRVLHARALVLLPRRVRSERVERLALERELPVNERRSSLRACMAKRSDLGLPEAKALARECRRVLLLRAVGLDLLPPDRCDACEPGVEALAQHLDVVLAARVGRDESSGLALPHTLEPGVEDVRLLALLPSRGKLRSRGLQLIVVRASDCVRRSPVREHSALQRLVRVALRCRHCRSLCARECDKARPSECPRALEQLTDVRLRCCEELRAMRSRVQRKCAPHMHADR